MKSTLSYFASLLFLWLSFGILSAQTAEEEALANLLNQAWALRETNPAEARALITEASPTSERLRADNLLAKCNYISAALFVDEGELQSAKQDAEKALRYYQKANLPAGVSRAYDLLGNIAKHQRDYPRAFHYYQEQINLIRETPSLTDYLPYAYMAYSTLFQDMNVCRPALDYMDRAENLLPVDDLHSQSVNKLNQAHIYLELAQLRRARSLVAEAEPFFRELGDIEQIAKCRNVMANVALLEERFSDATILFSEALAVHLSDPSPSVEGRINYLVNLSRSYLGEAKVKAAGKAVFEAYNLAQNESEDLNSLFISVKQIRDYYFHIESLDSALKYMEQAANLEEELFNLNRQYALLAAEAEYDKTRHLADKDKEIIEVIDQKKRLYFGFGFLFLAFLVLGAAFWQYGQRKKAQVELMLEKEKNQEQLLQGMIKEQELQAIGYIIEGQEKEKKRVAEDLHDGLGGTLAAIRISLEQFRRRLIKEENLALEEFDYAFELLREATEDVRRISHDMGAVRLKHGGLVTALEDMCRNLSRHQTFVAKLETEGIEMLRINSEVEFHIYRIAQELFQNVIKHAAANEVRIQLTNAGGRLHLYMWDDGRGFVVETVHEGMGMQNLRLRTQQLNGKIHIDSTPGRGTYTHISIPV
ncbi:MAG: sensor histidine kinase [Bacteroidota bacterium]